MRSSSSAWALETVLVEVAQDRPDPRPSGGRVQLERVDETVPSGSPLGGQILRERSDDPRGQPQRADELAGRLSWMHIDPVDREDRLERAEALVLELAERRPVERVGARRGEPVEVEQRGAQADLLVGGERHAQSGAGQLRVGGEVGDRAHHLRDPGLVVGAEQRVAACR